MLTIPRGFQAGSVLKIKDHGLPIYKSDQEHEAYGHLFVKIMPKIPRHLSEEQEKILVSVKNLF
jgi:DnaJ-class molecular chaperone